MGTPHGAGSSRERDIEKDRELQAIIKEVVGIQLPGGRCHRGILEFVCNCIVVRVNCE